AVNNKIDFIDISQSSTSTSSSTSSSSTALKIPPASPSNLAVSSASSTSLKLTWSDNSTREDGYKIERSTDGKTWSQITSVGTSTTSYTNTGLSSGKKYYYRVRAYNTYGNSSYTNTASATTGTISSGGSTGGSTGGTIIPHDSSASSPNAVITSLGTSAFVGTAVNVQATNSSLGSGTPLTARYEWNFGDSAGKYNTLVGFNAAHVYDKSGTYTITLKIINESGKVDTATTNVTIAADTRKTIYVSNDGNDSNNGSSSSPVKTFARADALMGDNNNYEILFNRGDTFTLTNGMTFGGDNIVMGAYGSGSNPILKYTGVREYGAIIWQRGSSNFATVENITFDSIFTGSDSSNMPDGTSASGTNFTVRNCQFLNLGAAFNGNVVSHGLLLQDNSAPSVTGIKAYFAWLAGNDLVLLGNKVANSTREHVVRSAGSDRLLIAYNDFTNLNRTSVDQYDTAKGCMTIHKGSYTYIANNTVNVGPLSIGPLAGNTALDDTGARLNYTVVEANKVNAQTLILHGSQHIMFRNNISTVNGDVAYMVDGWNSQYNRGVVDLKLYNNTGIDNDTEGNFIKVQGDVNGIDLVNNLYVAPNLQPGGNRAAPVYVNDDNLNSFKIITNNVWSVGSILSYAQGGINYIWPSWSDARGYQTPTEWNAWSQVGSDIFSKVTLSGYTPSSAASSAGTWTPGVFYDYYGKLRPTTGIAAGAVEA
ncbi:MAG TPA: PKD domain-containing protein, partial [Tepidisphaeraceae bacterium]|nr:PKD domain-containing protein [Tepidisphaeraceae bacterium]